MRDLFWKQAMSTESRPMRVSRWPCFWVGKHGALLQQYFDDMGTRRRRSLEFAVGTSMDKQPQHHSQMRTHDTRHNHKSVADSADINVPYMMYLTKAKSNRGTRTITGAMYV